MSTFRTTLVGPLTGTTMNLMSGLSKAWAYLPVSGGVPSVGQSFNVTSVTDAAVGKATPNFTASMSANNYAVSNLNDNFHNAVSTTENLVGSSSLYAYGSSHTAVDPGHHSFLIMGTLA